MTPEERKDLICALSQRKVDEASPQQVREWARWWVANELYNKADEELHGL